MVNWPVIALASTCFALWAFFVNKSGLRWPLAPAVFCLTQGVISFPIVIYNWRKMRGMEGDLTGSILAAVGGLILLCFLHYMGKNSKPELHMNWAYLAAVLGAIGLYALTNELARLAELKETGDKIRGLTIASTIALETVIVIMYHFWDVRKTGERVTMMHIIGTLLICSGVFCLFMKKNPIEKIIPSLTGTERTMVEH